MGTRISMQVLDDGIIVIHVQGLVVVMMVPIALGMECHMVKLSGPRSRSRGCKQCSCLPDEGQHQHERTNRAGHGASLTDLRKGECSGIPNVRY